MVSTGDFVQVEAWATTAPKLSTAKWKPLYQIDATGQYTTEKAGRRQQTRVIEDIPEGQVNDFVVHQQLSMTNDQKLRTPAIKKLQQMNVEHHRLGHTFP